MRKENVLKKKFFIAALLLTSFHFQTIAEVKSNKPKEEKKAIIKIPPLLNNIIKNMTKVDINQVLKEVGKVDIGKTIGKAAKLGLKNLPKLTKDIANLAKNKKVQNKLKEMPSKVASLIEEIKQLEANIQSEKGIKIGLSLTKNFLGILEDIDSLMQEIRPITDKVVENLLTLLPEGKETGIKGIVTNLKAVLDNIHEVIASGFGTEIIELLEEIVNVVEEFSKLSDAFAVKKATKEEKAERKRKEKERRSYRKAYQTG